MVARGTPACRTARAALVLPAVLVALTAAACADRPAAVLPAAEVTTQADCLAPQVLDALGLDPATSDGAARLTAHPDVPPQGAVPDGFLPESVVTCSTGVRLRDSAGTWAAVTQARREGDLDDLLDALAQDVTEPTGTCGPSDDADRTVVWLVDALGQAVRPVVAVDACGAPVRPVRDALARLDTMDSKDFPVELVVPSGPPQG